VDYQSPALSVPASTVGYDNTGRTLCYLATDHLEVLGHGLGVYTAHDDRRADFARMVDSADQIRRVVAIIAISVDSRRTARWRRRVPPSWRLRVLTRVSDSMRRISPRTIGTSMACNFSRPR